MMRRLLLSVLSILLVVVIVVVGTVAGAVAVLSSQWGRQALLEDGLPIVMAATPYRLELENVTSPDSEHWVISSLLLSHGDLPLVIANDISFLLHWTSLLEYAFHLQALKASYLWVEVNPDKWPLWADSGESAKPPNKSLLKWINKWRVSVDQVAFDAIEVSPANLPHPMTAQLFWDGLELDQIATTQPGLSLTSFDFSVDDGSQRIKASYLEGQLKADVRLDHFPLDVLSLWLDDFNRGWLSAEVEVEGSLLTPHAVGKIETSTVLSGLPLVARAKLNYASSVIGFEGIVGEWDTLTIKGQGTVNLLSKQLNFDVAEARMPISFANHFGVKIPPELTLDVRVNSGSITAGPLKPGPLKGGYKDIRYQGQIIGSGHYGQLPLVVSSDVDGGLSDVTLTNATLQTLTAQLKTGGLIDFSGPIALRGTFEGLTDEVLHPLLAVLPSLDSANQKAISKRLQDSVFDSSGEFELAGTLADPSIQTELVLRGSYKKEPVSVHGKISGSASQLNIQKFELKHPDNDVDSLIEVKGLVNLQASTLDLTLDAHGVPLRFLSLAELALPAGLSGRLTVQSQVTGSWKQPKLNLVAEGKSHLSGRYQGESFELTMDNQLVNGRMTLNQMALSAGSLHADAQGVVVLDAGSTPSGKLDVSGKFTGLSDRFLGLLSLPVPEATLHQLRMMTRGDVHLSGTLEDPIISANVVLRGSLQGQALGLQAELSGPLSALTLKQVKINVGSGSAEAELIAGGNINLVKEMLDLTIAADDVPLELLNLAGYRLPDALLGQVSMKGTVNGPWLALDVAIKGELKGTYNEQAYRVPVDARFIRGSLAIDETNVIINDKQVMTITGHLQKEKQDLSVMINDLDLSLLALLGWEDGAGTFNADLTYSGDLQHSQLYGNTGYRNDFVWTNERFQLETAPIDVKTDINTVDERVQVRSKVFIRGQRTSELEARFRLAKYRNWLVESLQVGRFTSIPAQFELSGSLDLKVLQAIEQNDLASFGGIAELNLEGQGSVDDLSLEGSFNLSDAYYQNELSGTKITDIEIQALLDGGSAHVSYGRASTPGNGRLELSGDVNWQKDKNVQLKLQAEDVVLVDRPELEAALTGELTLTGDAQGYLLAGTIAARPLVVKVNSSFGGVPEIQVQERVKDSENDRLRAKREGELSGLGSIRYPINVDLNIVADQQAYLVGRGLNTELKGGVNITGALDRLQYSGQFETLRGHMQLFNKRFDLTEGTAKFDDSGVVLRVLAKHVSKGMTFNVAVAGTVDKLSLELSSDPVLPQDEVLSRLLFGKSVKDMSPLQAVRLLAAIQTLQGGNSLLPDPVEYARKLVSVDDLNIESEETETGTGVRVGVGKYLSDRVYVEVERTPDPNKPWQGRVDVELTPSLHLETRTAGSADDDGVELIWRKDY